ncbi:MAG TPA: isochorismate synthase [Actinopolymorphaceae bacterium]
MTLSPALRADYALDDLPRLVVRTIEISDEINLLDVLPATEATTWLRRGEGFVGLGEAACLDVSGPDRFAVADAWWSAVADAAAVRDEVGVPGTGLVAFGSFTFADDAGPSSLVIPRVVLGHRGNRYWITTIAEEPELPRVPAPGSLVPASPPPRAPVNVTFADGACTGAEWTRAVEAAVRRIEAGELDKVVLARDLLAVASEPVDLRWPLRRLAERYPACWTYAVRGLIGATPELLVRLDNGLVTSRVLAGTIRRSDDDAHDLALAASLARSSKDLEEHEYAVRSVAEALAPHCSSMNVPESPFVLHLPNVMHLATDLAGVLADTSTSLQLAAALHPSAAVCGTPTPVALRLISELERMNRGRYAGPVGWMDASGNGEWGIALRCAQLDPADPTRLRLFAGCGIVAGSVPEAELAEAQAKLVPIRDALTC